MMHGRHYSNYKEQSGHKMMLSVEKRHPSGSEKEKDFKRNENHSEKDAPDLPNVQGYCLLNG